ncbi:bifunctional UDP-sugar hydrolase/5'-nucleotidase UshA [Providencia huaxiensis]|nr:MULTISPECIES: bifunctional UDP-sugar hydrolase/5'-nucleotidase UshA [Providencia]ELR5073561.1 bifunctional UDP-sugar hydrolase/5'-nucleotidase [Providencia stuartii]ELR5070353.1 bifunctional UDP-sugar hydrolase/5'-nucleotidase [Providencia rettgeri]ELR5222247.1 bifunctional UDP-sugar hydrolase/5'-nucleotidase [Providencia rettgeri]MBV2189438.1 bifunctional UDP-sugar hydrolase/5'-nucleotidase UshA [Providencia rettgeri]MDX7322183.1 bifunctional UDP-sugar hydrolase/5'-nucleotidase UshA [Provi
MNKLIRSTKQYAARLGFALLTLLLISCSAPQKSSYVTLLHTNDHHGHFWQSKHGEYGLAAQKTLVDSIREEVSKQGGETFLLSGGDINTGTPESDLLNAKPDFIGMNLVGYDAMAIGNHEFDHPVELLKQQEQWANFPFLSANIYDKTTDQRLFSPYVVLKKGNVKIAFIGVTTPDTPKLGSKKILQNVRFTDPITEVKTLSTQIRKDNIADMVVVLSHLGYYEDGKSGTSAYGDVELARALSPGDIDGIISAHSHSTLCMVKENSIDLEYKVGEDCRPDYQNGVWIMQAGEWGKFVGRANFQITENKITLLSYQMLPVNLKYTVKDSDGNKQYVYYTEEIKADPSVITELTPYQQQGEEKLGVIIGKTENLLQGDRRVVRHQQTNLGKLIILAQMWKTDANFGLISSGSIRAPIEQGDITYRDILTVQPFGNSVGFAEMTGKELIPYLTTIANMTPGAGAYPQFANITFDLSDGKLKNIKIAGNPIELNKTYRFSLPSYNANGGDGYPIITDRFMNTGSIDADILKTYIEENTPINL